LYTVQIELNGYEISDNCNCPAHYTYGECKHICATLLAIADEQNKVNSGKRSETKNARYRQAEELIEHFGQSRYDFEKLVEDEDSYLNVEFLLRTYTSKTFYREKDIVEIQMKIGTKRLYIVKDIRELLDSISNNVELKFGKHFTYDPSYHVFQKNDMAIIDKLIQFYRTETIYNTDTSHWAGNTKSGKSLVVPPYASDNFLVQLQHQNCIFQQEDVAYNQLQIIEEDLPFSFLLENGKAKEFQLKLSGHTSGNYYESYGLYANEGKIHKLTVQQQRALKQFVPLLKNDRNPIIPISTEQVGTFVSQAMPKLKQIGNVVVAKTVSTIIMNPELRVKLFVEGTSDRIEVKVEYHYDSIVINPIAQRKAHDNKEQTILIRDTEQEQLFMNAFEDSALVVSGDQYYTDDEEDIFGFLYDTLAILEEKADIFLTPAIKSLILPTEKMAKVAVDIHSSGNLLEVDFSLDGIDYDRVPHILQSVIEKKRYIRLPNGAFLSLDDEQLKDVAELYKELNDKSIEMVNGKMNIPLYRGLQIEERLTQLDKQHRKFGRKLTEFILPIINQ